MKHFYHSKKFWAAIAGVVVVAIGSYIELDTSQQKWIVGVILTYIASVMGADWGKEAKAIEADAAERMMGRSLEDHKEEAVEAVDTPVPYEDKQ